MNFREWLKINEVEVARQRAYRPGMVRFDMPIDVNPHVKHIIAGASAAVQGSYDRLMQRTGAPDAHYQHFSNEREPTTPEYEDFIVSMPRQQGQSDKQLYANALQKAMQSPEVNKYQNDGIIDTKYVQSVGKPMDDGTNVTFHLRFPHVKSLPKAV